MTNKILNKNIVSNNAEDNIPECNFTRESDKLPEPSIEDETPTRLATGGASYPPLPTTSPWNAPADHGFCASRDRIDEADVCSNTFGMDVSGKSTPEVSPIQPQATLEGTDAEALPTPSSAVPSTFPRGVKKTGRSFQAFLGTGITTEFLGTYGCVQDAEAAVRKAEQERR